MSFENCNFQTVLFLALLAVVVFKQILSCQTRFKAIKKIVASVSLPHFLKWSLKNGEARFTKF